MNEIIDLFNAFIDYMSGTRLGMRAEFIIKYVIPFCIVYVIVRFVWNKIKPLFQKTDYYVKDDKYDNQFDELTKRRR